MINNCQRIEVTGVYPWISDDLKIDGKIYLDIDQGVIRTTERIDDSLLNSIQVMAAIGLTLKKTPKNIIVLNQFISSNSGKHGGQPCKVYVYNGTIDLPLTDLFVMSDDEENFQCELRHPNTFWADMSDKLKINEILFDPIQFNKTNIYTLNNSPAFVDGGNGIKFPYVNYGQFSLEAQANGRMFLQNIYHYDLRPFVHLLDILRRGFAKLGYGFRCPPLETPHGRRLIAYLLRNDYGNVTNNNITRSLNVTLQDEINVDDIDENQADKEQIAPDSARMSFTVPFSNIVSDPGGNWVNRTPTEAHKLYYYYFGSGFIGKLTSRIYYDIKYKDVSLAKRKDVEIRVDIMIDNPGLLEEPLSLGYNSVIIRKEKDKTSFVEIELDDQEIPPYSKLYVTFTVVNLYQRIKELKVMPNSYFTITPKKSIYSDGDTIDLYNELDSNISFLSLIKATSHLFAGKIYQKLNNSTIWLMPTFTSEYFNEIIEGFFNVSDYVDITNYIVPKSLKRSIKSSSYGRNVRVGFRNSSDPYILSDEKLKTDKTQVFDALYTNVLDKGKDPIESRNELFEPTINKFLPLLVNYGDPNPSLLRLPVDMPFLTDNKDGKLSFNISPRLLYYAGYDNYKVKNKSFLGTESFETPGVPYEGVDSITAYAFNKANMYNSDNSPIIENLVYGNEETDLFKSFWQSALQEIDNGIAHDLLAYLNDGLKNRLSLRSLIYFEYGGDGYSAFINEIRDWDGGCSGLSTPMVIMPASTGLRPPELSEGGDIEIRDNCEYGEIALEVTQTGSCYTASLIGTSYLTIEDISFRYKLISETDWIEGDTFCDPTGTFIFQIIISFLEDCPDYVGLKVIEPCNNSSSVIFNYDPNTRCLTISVDENEIISEIDQIELYYSIDGGALTLYTAPLCDLSGIDVIDVTGTITFVGGCTPVDVSGQFNFPFTDYDCSQNTPEVNGTTTPDCRVLPLRTGNVINEIVLLDIIMYRYSEDDEWKLWDESTPIDFPVFLNRIVMFNGCEPKSFEYEYTG